MRLPGFCGPSYTDRSVNVDCERTINWYPSAVGGGALGKSQLHLARTPGIWPFVELPAGPIRATWYMDGRLFVVAGGGFYEVWANHRGARRGMVAVDGHPATISGNGTAGYQLFITSGGHGYIFNTQTGEFNEIADPDFPTPVWGGVYVDGYFVALRQHSRQFWISDILDGQTWNGLDVAEMSTATDNLRAMAANHRELWLFGSQHTHVWYNSGYDSFPFQPVGGTSIEHGILAPWSVCSLDNTLFWLGQSALGPGSVYRANGYMPERISTDAVDQVLQSAGQRLEEGIAYSYSEEGHSFYVLYVPVLETTWTYDVATNFWHERAYWDTDEMRWKPHLGRCHAFAFSKHLVGGRADGKVYEMSRDLLDDDDTPGAFLTIVNDPTPGVPNTGATSGPAIEVPGVDGWYPSFSPGGAHLASGAAALYLDGALALSDACVPTWLSTSYVLYGKHSGAGVGKVSVSAPTTAIVVSTTGYNRLAAGGGHWYGELSVSPYTVVKDDVVVATDAFGVDCDDAGRGAWLTGHDTALQNIVVNGAVWASGRAVHGGRVRVCKRGVVWQEARTTGISPFTMGKASATADAEILQASYLAEHHTIPIDTPTGPYLLSMCSSGLILRAWGETTGWVVTTGDAYYPDGAYLGNGAFKLAWSTSAGALWTRIINIQTDAAVNLAVASTPPVVSAPLILRPCWFGYFFAVSDQYGDNLGAPQNWTYIKDANRLATWDAPMLLDAAIMTEAIPYAANVAGIYVSGGSEVDLETAAAAAIGACPSELASVPIVGCCDGWEPTGAVDGVDWLAIECYTLVSETAAQNETKIRGVIDVLGPSAPVVLIGLSYTSNALHTQDATQLMASQAVPAAIARDYAQVTGIMMFSDGRPTGTRDHEEWRPVHQQIFAGIPAAPAI